jgi:DNA-binding LacI/PurR family transcriptional regulator
MTVHALDRGRGLSPRRRRIVQAQFTLGDIVEAVMHFAADSREAAVVVEDLMATGRIRFEFLKGMSPDGDLGSARRSGNTR